MQHSSKINATSKVKNLNQLFAFLLVSAFTGTASAETFTVSTESELNIALQTSSTNQQDDVINLAGSILAIESTISITNEDGHHLEIRDGTISRADDLPPFRLLQINDTDLSGVSTITFDSMTFENGSYDTDTNLPDEAGGAAVYSNGIPVIIIDSTFSNNISYGRGAGGAVRVNLSSLTISGSTFDGNRFSLSRGTGVTVISSGTIANGGAIATISGSQMTISNSIFSGNRALSGGAIATISGSQMTISDSLFSGNSANSGGAIAPDRESGTTTILRTTFSDNRAGTLGGAIWTRSKIEIDLSTFYRNNASVGGGALYFQPSYSEANGSYLRRNTFVENTGDNVANVIYFLGIVAKPELYANLFISNNINDNANCFELGQQAGSAAEFSLEQYNISDDDSCGMATVIANGADLFTLGTPELNGGTTPNIALQPDGAAVDAAGALGEEGCSFATDQRGFPLVNNCDAGSFEFELSILDGDADGTIDYEDNCPTISNPNQENLAGTDPDLGDACEDFDQDGSNDDVDNCPLISNDDQDNLDGDGLGDKCDDDIDGDGVINGDDAFPTDASETVDTDGDGIGNRADADDDNDLQSDSHEILCNSNPLDAASVAPDADGDNIPDCAELDQDGDGVSDDNDNCPLIANEDQEDANENGVGDVCDLVSDSQPVTVHKHVNFRGSSFTVYEGDVSFGDIKASSVGNDHISSIEIAPGYEVYACQHGGFRGRCETFTSSVSDLRDIGFNDTISSLRVSKTTTLPVTVYKHVNFNGISFSVGEGDVSFADIKASVVGNDHISSIEIADGYEVYACKHGGFRGRCETFTGSVSDLRDIGFNDTISSLRVQKQ